MKSFAIAAAVIAAVACQPETARAAECVTFASGEILCDDGSYAYYWSPAANEWQVLDRDATAAALGLSTGGSTRQRHLRQRRLVAHDHRRRLHDVLGAGLQLRRQPQLLVRLLNEFPA